MERLIKLIEKRKEIGKRKSYTKGGDYNDYIEYSRISELILDEFYKLYDEGKLGGNKRGNVYTGSDQRQTVCIYVKGV